MAATKVMSTIAMSGLGVAAALGTANSAEALPHMYKLSTDFLSSIAQKTTSSSVAFNVTGANSIGATTARAYRNGSSISANVTTQGGSMYARAYARCYAAVNAPYNTTALYSAVYSAWTTNSTVQAISCDSLIDVNGPNSGNGWVTTNWGAAVLGAADSNIPTIFRKVCNGQGCGPGDSIKVDLGFQQCVGGYTDSKTLVGGFPSESLNAPNPLVCDRCW